MKDHQEEDSELAQLRTIKIWLDLGTAEVKRRLADVSHTMNFPPCPVCRNRVTTYDPSSDPNRPGLTFHPCGCRYTADKATGRIETVRADDDNQ